MAEPIEVSQTDGIITVTRPNDEGEVRALHGLSRSLVANMVTGVTEGYRKTLEIVGVGYRVQAKGQDLEFSLGFSHPVTVSPPEGITLRVETPTRLVVEGIDKQQVGEVAANIRKLRKPDPYKGKGVRYSGRADPPQGREGWEVGHGWHQDQADAAHGRADASRAPGGTCGSARRSAAARARPGWPSPGPPGTSFAQLVDDGAGRTLAAASTLDAGIRDADGDKTAKARQVGALLARRARRRPASRAAVFDRGGYAYHGRVAALADGAREGGLASCDRTAADSKH